MHTYSSHNNIMLNIMVKCQACPYSLGTDINVNKILTVLLEYIYFAEGECSISIYIDL